MKPHYQDDAVTLFHGDCLDVLRELPDNSIHAVVTDPPYGLGFMGREWDDLPPGIEFATECLRVLKPGGHMLAFGGSRTWHRLTCAVEDAGFEIRDSVIWLYAQGFPKSRNVSKDARFCQCHRGGLDGGSTQGVEGLERRGAHGPMRPVRSGSETLPESGEAATPGVLLAQLPGQDGYRADAGRESDGLDGQDTSGEVRPGQSRLEGRGDVQEAEGQLHRPEVRAVSGGVPANGTVGRLHHGTPASDGSVDGSAAVPNGSRESHQPRSTGQPPGELGAVSDERGPQTGGVWPLCGGCGKPEIPGGLGTALKPAHEPIVVARKPLAGTVAANVLTHGTGALNIDGCRVGSEVRTFGGPEPERDTSQSIGAFAGNRAEVTVAGRWPANVVLDESQAAALDAMSGERTTGAWDGNRNTPRMGTNGIYGEADATPGYGARPADSGGASRFFPTFKYEPKAPTTERPRDGVTAHPTVKPLDLMRWLVRLVTPPGGTVLEPFAGSGTTAEACVIEGFNCIAIEREADYLPLIVARLTKPLQVALDFDV